LDFLLLLFLFPPDVGDGSLNPSSFGSTPDVAPDCSISDVASDVAPDAPDGSTPDVAPDAPDGSTPDVAPVAPVESVVFDGTNNSQKLKPPLCIFLNDLFLR